MSFGKGTYGKNCTSLMEMHQPNGELTTARLRGQAADGELIYRHADRYTCIIFCAPVDIVEGQGYP